MPRRATGAAKTAATMIEKAAKRLVEEAGVREFR
jgi:hypothetical protein